jgi:hypothetical protein
MSVGCLGGIFQKGADFANAELRLEVCFSGQIGGAGSQPNNQLTRQQQIKTKSHGTALHSRELSGDSAAGFMLNTRNLIKNRQNVNISQFHGGCS